MSHSHSVPNHRSCIPPGMPVTVAAGLHAHCSPLVLSSRRQTGSSRSASRLRLCFAPPRLDARVSSGTASGGRTRARPAPRRSARPEAPRPAGPPRARTRTTTRTPAPSPRACPPPPGTAARRSTPSSRRRMPLSVTTLTTRCPGRRDVGDRLGKALGPGQRDDDAGRGPAGDVVGPPGADQEAAAGQLGRVQGAVPVHLGGTEAPHGCRPRTADDHAEDRRGVGEVGRGGKHPLVEDVGVGRRRLVAPQPELGREHDVAARRPGRGPRPPRPPDWPRPAPARTASAPTSATTRSTSRAPSDAACSQRVMAGSSTTGLASASAFHDIGSERPSSHCSCSVPTRARYSSCVAGPSTHSST